MEALSEPVNGNSWEHGRIMSDTIADPVNALHVNQYWPKISMSYAKSRRLYLE